MNQQHAKLVLNQLDFGTPTYINTIQAAIRKHRGANLGPGILRSTINTLIQDGLVQEPARNTYTITNDGKRWLQEAN